MFGIHIHVKADVTINVQDPAATQAVVLKLTRIESKVDKVIRQGEQIMSANAEIAAFLDELNGYTNQLAEAQTVQTEKTAEIAADIADLLANADLSPEVRSRLQAASQTLQANVAFGQAQAATLTQLAAQHEVPLPPPVEPPAPPVEG